MLVTLIQFDVEYPSGAVFKKKNFDHLIHPVTGRIDIALFKGPEHKVSGESAIYSGEFRSFSLDNVVGYNQVNPHRACVSIEDVHFSAEHNALVGIVKPKRTEPGKRFKKMLEEGTPFKVAPRVQVIYDKNNNIKHVDDIYAFDIDY